MLGFVTMNSRSQPQGPCSPSNTALKMITTLSGLSFLLGLFRLLTINNPPSALQKWADLLVYFLLIAWPMLWVYETATR